MLVIGDESGSDCSESMLVPRNDAELAAIMMDNHALARPLRISGGGTRINTPAIENDCVLTTRAMNGIVTYEPGELTLIARVGTPVEEVEHALAECRQVLAFEPMDYRILRGSKGEPTIGGVVSANVSGPRRVRAGSCRDHLLGVRFVDGRGRIIKSGGRVMKNVTGLNLGRLLCGACGTLGVLTEVVLKTVPMSECEQTLLFSGLSVSEAVEVFSAAFRTPFEVSGAAFYRGNAWLRVEGLARQSEYRRDRLTALFGNHKIDILAREASRTLWRRLRDVHHFSGTPGAVWRICVKPTDAPNTAIALQALGGEISLDWGGGLIWYCGPGDVASVRKAAVLGNATLVRGDTPGSTQVFATERKEVAKLSAALRNTFDPAKILNSGLIGS